MSHPDPGRLREYVTSGVGATWAVSIKGNRVRSVEDGPPRREIVWNVTEGEPTAHCLRLDSGARPAMGSGAHGRHLVLEHVTQLLATTEVVVGQMRLTSKGVEIQPS